MLQEFLESEGILLNDPQLIPMDPYLEGRRQPEYKHVTPSSYDKLKQFMTMDRKVLRFFCVWDDRDSMFGEMRPYVSGSCMEESFLGATVAVAW